MIAIQFAFDHRIPIVWFRIYVWFGHCFVCPVITSYPSMSAITTITYQIPVSSYYTWTSLSWIWYGQFWTFYHLFRKFATELLENWHRDSNGTKCMHIILGCTWSNIRWAHLKSSEVCIFVSHHLPFRNMILLSLSHRSRKRKKTKVPTIRLWFNFFFYLQWRQNDGPKQKEGYNTYTTIKSSNLYLIILINSKIGMVLSMWRSFQVLRSYMCLEVPLEYALRL